MARSWSEQCACVPSAAHAQAPGGPWRSKGEFKETGATRLRVPRPGRGSSHHAGDSGAAYSGGSESAGGEARPEDRQAGHGAAASWAWAWARAQPCFDSADPGPWNPRPMSPNIIHRSIPGSPFLSVGIAPPQPAVVRELFLPPPTATCFT